MDSNARIEDLRQRLKSRDHKMTPARQEILKIFDDRPGQHLSAEDVHDYLREKQSNIGLATVYRSLERDWNLEMGARDSKSIPRIHIRIITIIILSV